MVVLNVGYGRIEAIGLMAGYQALKAGDLDFLGAGRISVLGLLALRWSLAWPARSALIQGLFFGALGLGIVAATTYRALMLNQPEAKLIGIIGSTALIMNGAAVAVLLPHRKAMPTCAPSGYSPATTRLAMLPS